MLCIKLPTGIFDSGNVWPLKGLAVEPDSIIDPTPKDLGCNL